ncbi:CNH domain-containing protein [Mycena crocata]|nr:CNH domain-containing protein [Mycena crocata]
MPVHVASGLQRGCPRESSEPGWYGSKWNQLRNAVKIFSPIGIHSQLPFPRAITDQISMEIYERIIDHLNDKRSLLSCILVCPSWVPRSRTLLRKLTVCHPVSLVEHDGLGTITCAVPAYPGNTGGIIYGTYDGIYKGAPDGSQPRLLSIPDVSQIGMLPDRNLFICLADGVLTTMPLSTLNAGTCQDINLDRVLSHVAFFTVYRSTTKKESHRVCALQTSALSSTIKVFDVGGSRRVATLVDVQEFYIPCNVYSVRFVSRIQLAAAIKKGFGVQGGFEIVDLVTLERQTLLDLSDPALEFAFKKVKPVTVFKVSDIFLACYSRFGFYIDHGGRMVRNQVLMRWTENVRAFALHEPYILAFGKTHVEVWNIETAEMLQEIHRSYSLLNAPEPGEAIIGLSLVHDDVSEIVFSRRLTWDELFVGLTFAFRRRELGTPSGADIS